MQAGRRADRLGITRQGPKRVTGSHAVSDRAEAPHTVAAGAGHNGAGIDNRHLHRGRRVGRLIQRAAPRRVYAAGASGACPRRRGLAGSRRSRVARGGRTCHRSRRATRMHPIKDDAAVRYPFGMEYAQRQRAFRGGRGRSRFRSCGGPRGSPVGQFLPAFTLVRRSKGCLNDLHR